MYYFLYLKCSALFNVTEALPTLNFSLTTHLLRNPETLLLSRIGQNNTCNELLRFIGATFFVLIAS